MEFFRSHTNFFSSLFFLKKSYQAILDYLFKNLEVKLSCSPDSVFKNVMAYFRSKFISRNKKPIKQQQQKNLLSIWYLWVPSPILESYIHPSSMSSLYHLHVLVFSCILVKRKVNDALPLHWATSGCEWKNIQTSLIWEGAGNIALLFLPLLQFAKELNGIQFPFPTLQGSSQAAKDTLL